MQIIAKIHYLCNHEIIEIEDDITQALDGDMISESRVREARARDIVDNDKEFLIEFPKTLLTNLLLSNLLIVVSLIVKVD